MCIRDREYPALVLCNAIFGGTPLSKLFLNVREKLSLCYYASSMLEKLKGPGVLFAGVIGRILLPFIAVAYEVALYYTVPSPRCQRVRPRFF